jgi:hypothetical protein
MATRARNGRVSFDAAVALLIQNQAALAAQHIAFLDQMVKVRQEMRDIESDIRQIIARIEKDLETIKAVLIRHETLLEKLPEAIREKIGFKGQ